jgi:putative tricarboxylic transport membrane protein
VSLASSEDNKLLALFGRPITMILLLLLLITLATNSNLFNRRRKSK